MIVWRRASHYPAMRRPLLGLSCCWALIVGCAENGSEPPESVVGKSAAQASEIATEVVCEYAARCGEISISCADCADSEGCGGCFAEHHEVEYGECEARLSEQLRTGFGCEPVDPADERLVDECLAALPSSSCADVEDAEAWANGGAGDDPRDLPEACDALEDIRYRCFDYEDPEQEPGVPIPV